MSETKEIKDSNLAKIYKMTRPEYWGMINGTRIGRRIDPILFTGVSKDFEVKISTEELKGLFDAQGDIRYHKVLEWSLPIFKGESPELCDWLVARMRNYMLHLIRTTDWKPIFYDPIDGRYEIMGLFERELSKSVFMI